MKWVIEYVNFNQELKHIEVWASSPESALGKFYVQGRGNIICLKRSDYEEVLHEQLTKERPESRPEQGNLWQRSFT